MDLQLKDKIIIVTGGAKGIGEGIVKLLAAEGACPVIVGRNEEDNLKTLNDIELNGGKAWQVVAELTEPSECAKAVNAVIKKFGRIAGLVNHAGINDGDAQAVLALFLHGPIRQRGHTGLGRLICNARAVGFADRIRSELLHLPDRRHAGRADACRAGAH